MPKPGILMYSDSGKNGYHPKNVALNFWTHFNDTSYTIMVLKSLKNRPQNVKLKLANLSLIGFVMYFSVG